MKEQIINFLQHQQVATICCVDEENHPYCFSCFFAFDKELKLLYFKSKPETKHGQLLLENSVVSGTIQPDKLNRLAIKGIQFSGRVINKENGLLARAATVYHAKYPFALAVAGDMWVIEVGFVKMTDNTLNFGKKIVWQRETLTSKV